MQAAGPRRLRRYRIFFSSKIDLTLITPLQQPSYSFMPDFRGLSSTSEHVSMRLPLTLPSPRPTGRGRFGLRRAGPWRSGGRYSRVIGAATAKRPAALGYAGAGPALRDPSLRSG